MRSYKELSVQAAWYRKRSANGVAGRLAPPLLLGLFLARHTAGHEGTRTAVADSPDGQSNQAPLLVGLLAGIAVVLVLQHRLYEWLRNEHPGALKTLAESTAGVMAFPRYFWRRHYLGLCDAAFNRRADCVRRYWKVWFLYFLLVGLALLVALGFGA